MLNGLIFFAAVLLLTLVGVKYGLLEILAIILAILALIPFAVSAYLYFARAPTVTYQVANKQTSAENNIHLYDFWLGFMCQSGRVILDSVHVVPEFPVVAAPQPSENATRRRSLLLEEPGFAQVLTFDGQDLPMYSKNGRVFGIRLESQEPRETINLHIYFDAQLDPFRQGFWAIFQPSYRYRLEATVKVDFVKLDRQEGVLRRAWK